jgi:hypothetical protein
LWGFEAENGIYHRQDSLGVLPSLWSITDLNGDGRSDLVDVGRLDRTVSVTQQRSPAKKTAPKCRPSQHSTQYKPCRR